VPPPRPPRPSHAPQAARQRLDDAAELELHQRLHAFTARQRGAREADRALRAAVRVAHEFFRAAEAALAILPPGGDRADVAFALPREATWDGALVADFVRGRPARIPHDTMLARVRRHGRMWGAIIVRAPGADFHWDSRRALSAIAAAATETAERIDQERIREVRARIDRKVMEQIRPKDLFYQILHGLRSLIEYDHSAAVLTCDGDRAALEVAAEQVTFRKGGSRRVGARIPLDPRLRAVLERGQVLGFDHDGSDWTAWTGAEEAEDGSVDLAALLDYNRDSGDEDGSAPEAAILCAPLVAQGDPLGLLKVAATHPGAFGAYEVDLVSRFLPQATVALQNAQRTESLENRMLAAERKHAMADLARGVSHDVNNALGAVIPLVQEMRVELESGRMDPAVAAGDLREIERSLQVCRRIFGGMLAFARGSAQRAGPIFVRQEIETTLAILRDGIQRRGIAVEVVVAEDLPAVSAVRADVEQLLLNLVTNARDAMEGGGRLTILARRCGDAAGVELVIADTGCGISAESLARVQEPFYTTKSGGTGLGLAICRSIVAQLRGRMRLESEVGRGTRVTITLPAGPAEEGRA
jgi:signal transduction histidine kinase